MSMSLAVPPLQLSLIEGLVRRAEPRGPPLCTEGGSMGHEAAWSDRIEGPPAHICTRTPSSSSRSGRPLLTLLSRVAGSVQAGSIRGPPSLQAAAFKKSCQRQHLDIAAAAIGAGAVLLTFQRSRRASMDLLLKHAVIAHGTPACTALLPFGRAWSHDSRAFTLLH